MKIAPGSKDYCSSACEDECSAMKADGDAALHGTVKEVETFCTYDRQPDGSFTGVQRTATFLAPDAAYTSGASLAEQQVRGSRSGVIGSGPSR